MLTTSSPLMGKELTKFAYLLAVTIREIFPVVYRVRVDGSGREGTVHAPANTGNGSALILRPRHLA